VTARELGKRSRAASRLVTATAGLALFAEDAVVQDPIGPSPFDPEGTGHRGLGAIAKFYDEVVAPSERITFEIERFLPLRRRGPPNVGNHPHVAGGGRHVAVVRGVYTYRADGNGKLAALRAFWEFDAPSWWPPRTSEPVRPAQARRTTLPSLAPSAKAAGRRLDVGEG